MVGKVAMDVRSMPSAARCGRVLGSGVRGDSVVTIAPTLPVTRAYDYASPSDSATLINATTERGPPTVYFRDADGHLPHGA